MSSGRCQAGFTYLTALLLIAALGAGLAGVAELWSNTRQREKEAELIWIGRQFVEAIGLYYQRTPGSIKRYPEKLEDLLEDRRRLDLQRYLRRIYADPVTGKPQWGLIPAPDGGIMGIHSLSTAQPLRQINDGRTHADWRFMYVPPPGVAPGLGRS